MLLPKGKGFLKIVPQIKSYSEILEIKSFLEGLFERIVETNCLKTNDLEKLFQYEKVDLGVGKMKSLIDMVFENLGVIKKRVIEKYITMSEYFLVDFNWNVNVIYF